MRGSTIYLALLLTYLLTGSCSADDSVRDHPDSGAGQTVLPVEVPDRAGATVKGIVYCEKEPLAGVRVSDGKLITVTDEQGRYWLPSAREHGYVFVCLPSGYMPAKGSNVTPGFWTSLTASAGECERRDFELKRVDDRRHIIVAAADMHLAGRGATNDVKQLREGFLREIAAFVAEDPAASVYTMNLGDFTWDRFWYSHGYDLKAYKATMADYPTPVFHVIGNHDHDPYRSGDEGGTLAFRREIGPVNYSMDIGAVRYIFLDDVEYINDGGAQGTLGDRSYRSRLAADQLEWLKSDLASLTDRSTPVMIIAHAHTHHNFNEAFINKPAFSPASRSTELLDALGGFSNVHILTGHSHVNTTMQLSPGVIEHNTAAVCSQFWWPGKLTGVNVCSDGTPAGYGVYVIDGREIEWHYKSIGKERDRQFRAYDMNVVREFFADPSVIAKLAQYPSRRGRGNDYLGMEDNAVMINVWNYDPQWRITVTENGRPLTVERVFERDPLSSLCFDIPRVDAGQDTGTWVTDPNPHLFKVRAQMPGSTLKIAVTDRFGNVFREDMTRPKAFSTTMN